MFKNINIGSKITGLVLAVVLLTVLAISYIAYEFSKNAIEERYFDSINSLSDLKKEKLQDYFTTVAEDGKALNNLPAIKSGLSILLREGEVSIDSLGIESEPLVDTTNYDEVLNIFSRNKNISHIYLTNL